MFSFLPPSILSTLSSLQFLLRIICLSSSLCNSPEAHTTIPLKLPVVASGCTRRLIYLKWLSCLKAQTGTLFFLLTWIYPERLLNPASSLSCTHAFPPNSSLCTLSHPGLVEPLLAKSANVNASNVVLNLLPLPLPCPPTVPFATLFGLN